MTNIDELEKQLLNLEERVSTLEKKGQSIKVTEIDGFPQNVIQKIEKIPTRQLTLISLKINHPQSIEDLQKNLLKLGWVRDTFFEKNFASTLVNKGLIQQTEVNAKNKSLYSLTMKGDQEAEKILRKYQNTDQ